MNINMNKLDRRNFLKTIGGLSALVLLNNCNSTRNVGSGGRGSSSGTGVQGYDTPEQILSRPFVADAIDEVRDSGYSFSPQRDVNPPNIEGVYLLSGRGFLPIETSLYPGTFVWKNQTEDNHIDTEYEEFYQGSSTQSGVSSLGEIIRGNNNEFTVYSILRVNDYLYGCDERVVLLIDGRKDNSGDVSCLYLGVPEGGGKVCLAVSAGTLNLEWESSAKEGYKKLKGSPLLVPRY